MKKELSYKGYYGSVEYSLEDDVLYGKVIGIKGLLSYEGQTLDELRKDFQGVIDEHLEDCKVQGIMPQKSYKGSFNVRITPELHMKAAAYAASQAESLNSLVEKAIKKYVNA